MNDNVVCLCGFNSRYNNEFTANFQYYLSPLLVMSVIMVPTFTEYSSRTDLLIACFSLPGEWHELILQGHDIILINRCAEFILRSRKNMFLDPF